MDDPAFDARKAAVQRELASASVDRSPKGTVDNRCWPMIDFLNSCEQYVTTSSCSGRVAMWLDPPKADSGKADDNDHDDDDDGADNVPVLPEASGAGKKGRGGRWLHVTHDLPVLADFTAALDKYVAECSPDASTSPSPFGVVWVRFEPYILHVQARSLAAASQLLRAGLAAGFRNSGIVAGGTDTHPTYVVAFRLTSAINAPVLTALTERHVASAGGVVEYLVVEAEEKMRATWARADRLLEAFRSLHNRPASAPKEDPKDRWARKREVGLKKQAAALAKRSASGAALAALALSITE
eukprot:TRINITY_DN1078_c0_g1_i1.p1 TRINITY_DN1078_c0_g1~~TRINITY_DN1078_c0_g1_i1.p1  ORF type:complete len:298 (+),score=61.05 TRINITY_DN1078_c0_g1_i1:56-949(+)